MRIRIGYLELARAYPLPNLTGARRQITIPRDAVCAFEGVDEDEALEYLKRIYGADITTAGALIEQPAGAGAGR